MSKLSKKVLDRIYKGLGANLYGQGINVSIQLVSVTVLISIWGVEKYGEWLVISALPMYLTISDFGVISAAGNKVAILFDQARVKLAVRIYRFSFSFVLIVVIIIGAMLIGFITLIGVDLLNIKYFDASEMLVLVSLLMLHVFFVMLSNVISIQYRAYKKMPLAVFKLNTVRLIEWGGGLLVVSMFSEVLFLVVTLLVVRLAFLIFILIFSYKFFGEFRFNLTYFKFDNKVFKLMLKPSIATMAFPLGLALSIQGMTILVSVLFGGGAVAVFNVYRTLSRVLVQLVTSINQAFWPELSYAYASNNSILIKKLIQRMKWPVFFIAVPGLIILYVFSPEIIGFWVGSEFVENDIILIGLLAVAFIHLLWQRYWVFLMAVNLHVCFSKVFLVSNIVCQIIAWPLSIYFGFYGVILALITSEFICLIASKKEHEKKLEM